MVDTFNVSVPLKSDHEISSSGLAINNSATLALEYESSDGSNKVFFTFLVYTALARVFLQQTTTKIWAIFTFFYMDCINKTYIKKWSYYIIKQNEL